jgi:hypothetical protein
MKAGELRSAPDLGESTRVFRRVRYMTQARRLESLFTDSATLRRSRVLGFHRQNGTRGRKPAPVDRHP